MRFLLDTHILLQSLHEPEKLDAERARTLKDLPFHHRDPFDRMLVAQSLALDIPLMTDDGKLAPYGCRLI